MGPVPYAIVITADGTTAYVVCTGGTVVPIAIATNRPGKPIRVGREPGVSVISPNGKTLYVTNGASASVTPISIATNTPGKAIKVGGAPYAIAITSNGRTVYVASQVPSGVTPISTATNTPGKPIKTGNSPWSIVCAPTVCRSSSTAG